MHGWHTKLIYKKTCLQNKNNYHKKFGYLFFYSIIRIRLKRINITIFEPTISIYVIFIIQRIHMKAITVQYWYIYVSLILFFKYGIGIIWIYNVILLIFFLVKKYVAIIIVYVMNVIICHYMLNFFNPNSYQSTIHDRQFDTQ